MTSGEVDSALVGYTLRSRNEILGFLKDRRYLIPLLPEIRKKIRRYFPDSRKVVVGIFIDPEANDCRQLAISIVTPLPVETACAQLERFDRDWWLDAIRQTQDHVCIDVEFA